MSVRRNDYERSKLAPACAPSPLRPVSRPDVATETMYTNQNGFHRNQFRSRVSEAKTESHNVSVVDAVFREMGHSIGPPSASMSCGVDCVQTTCDESLYFFTDLEGGARGLELLNQLPPNAKFVHLGDSTDIGSISTTVIHKLNEMKRLGHATNLIGNRDLNKVLFNSTLSYRDEDGNYDVPELLVKNGGVPPGMYDKFHEFIKSELKKISEMDKNDPRRVAFSDEAQLATILLVTAMHRWTRGTDRYWANAKKSGGKKEWRSVSTSTQNKTTTNSRMDVIETYLDQWETTQTAPGYISTDPGVDNEIYLDMLRWKAELDEYVNTSNIIYHNEKLGVVGVHDWFGEDATLLTHKNTFLSPGQIQGIEPVSTFQDEYAKSDFRVKDDPKIPRIRWNRMASTTTFGEWCSEVNRSAEALIRFESDKSSDSCCVAACRRYLVDVADLPSKSFMHGVRPANYIKALDDASSKIDLPKFVLVGHQPTFVGRMGRTERNGKTCHLVELDTQYTPYSRSVAWVRKMNEFHFEARKVEALKQQLMELKQYANTLFDSSGGNVTTWSLGEVTFHEDGLASCQKGVLCAYKNYVGKVLTYDIAPQTNGGHYNGGDGTVCTLASLLFLQEIKRTDAPTGVQVWEPLSTNTGPELSSLDSEILDNAWTIHAAELMQHLNQKYNVFGQMRKIVSTKSLSTTFWALRSYSSSCDLSVNNYAN